MRRENGVTGGREDTGTFESRETGSRRESYMTQLSFAVGIVVVGGVGQGCIGQKNKETPRIEGLG